MTKYLKYLALFGLVALVFTATGANAQDAFGTVISKMTDTFKNARAVIFVLGGFGLVGLGSAAIFGKINWKWLAALAVGLAIVAIAGAIVDYATTNTSGSVSDFTGSNFVDTLE